MKKVDDTHVLFQKGFNCCQAVLAPFSEELSLNQEIALRIASSFGGGIAGMGLTFGAVTGAFIIPGLRYGRNKADDVETKERNYRAVREFTDRFKSRHEAIGCCQLLGYDTATPEGKAAVREKNLTKTLCPKFVESAAEILEDIL